LIYVKKFVFDKFHKPWYNIGFIRAIIFMLEDGRLVPMEVIDNFFDNPDIVRKFALDQDFYPCKDHPNGGTWPGVRSISLEELAGGEQIWEEYLYKCFRIGGVDLSGEEYDTKFEYEVESSFQIGTLVDGDSWIHQDKANFSHVLLVYLTPEPPPSSGTCIYEPRERDFDHVDINNSSNFRLASTISNKYNRAVVYDPRIFHKSEGYFGHTKEDGRLFLASFFSIRKVAKEI
jgi:cell wall assembly regulator SMI1